MEKDSTGLILNKKLHDNKSNYMIYRKITKTNYNADDIVLKLELDYDGGRISTIAYYNKTKVASIVSVIRNLDVLNCERSYEVLLVEATNNLDVMIRLLRFFYENMRVLGIKYLWFETNNSLLIKCLDGINRMLSLTTMSLPNTNCYYVDLRNNELKENVHPNQ